MKGRERRIQCEGEGGEFSVKGRVRIIQCERGRGR